MSQTRAFCSSGFDRLSLDEQNTCIGRAQNHEKGGVLINRKEE